ncbi:MAG: hypothetical protein JW763_09805 [candidate division Zixibacteria bacterium]|nr:hypothetical protein [candidate division Zixibacteria bacterium]
MPHKLLFTGLILIAAFLLISCEQSSDKNAETPSEEPAATETAPAESAPSLYAEWSQLPKGESPGGGLIIREDGTYTRWDDHPDVKGASATGPYEVDMTVAPHALDLCVSECGGPGSEWTTLFCIFRFHGADTLEVRFAPDNNRYGAFADESDERTYLYTRKGPAPAKK